MANCVNAEPNKETASVASEKEQRCKELLEQYKKCMRLVLRNQHEAYFCLLELLDICISR